jgi:hypothetical protein
MAFWGQIAVEPVPAGPRFIDQDQMVAFGWHLPEAVVDIALARANGAEGDHLSVVLLSTGGDCTRLLRDSHADVERARRWPG